MSIRSTLTTRPTAVGPILTPSCLIFATAAFGGTSAARASVISRAPVQDSAMVVANEIARRRIVKLLLVHSGPTLKSLSESPGYALAGGW